MAAKSEDPKEVIEQIVSMAETARKNSILALEKVQVDDPFMKKAVKMLVDGVEPEVIEDLMAIEIEGMEERHGSAEGFMILLQRPLLVLV